MERMVVMGLGITGRAVVNALQRHNVDVIAIDDHITDELRDWAAQVAVTVTSCAEHDLETTLRGSDGLLPTPGLPDHHPVFAAATAAGVPVMSEFDLATLWDGRPCVAVTGTDGKTTVVTLVQRMLERSGIASIAVGNTDTPYVAAIEDPSTEVFVVEASSFRLGHSQRFAPQVGTWLNFGPDHLDAHASLSHYEEAKASIWQHLGASGCAIGNRNDPVVARHLAAVSGPDIETFGGDAPPADHDHGIVEDNLIVAGEKLLAISELSRSLPHDIQNGLAAAASARRVGADRQAMADVLREFTGLEHRVELIAEIDGVRYVNDSKATTPHASAAALGGFDSIVLLAGGKNKGLSFDDMLEHVDRINHVVAIGESAADIESVFSDRVSTSVATSMEEAVRQASDRANSGDVVLLSPACASYDWYKNYGERGRDFARIVRARLNGDPQ